MRILLVVAQNHSFLRFKSNELAAYPPLGLGYIASCLRNKGHSVKLLDQNIARMSLPEFAEIIRVFKPQIAGFTVYTCTVNGSLVMAQCIKDIFPKTLTVFGGPHVSYLGKETITNSCVDFIVKGEGEETMSELVSAIQISGGLENIKGIIFKRGNDAYDTGSRPLIQNLDNLPFPAYDLMERDSYYQSITRQYSNKRFATIMTSRGCPYECTFCSHEMFGKKVRFRSPENVVDELEFLKKEFNIGEIMIVDDSFTTDKARAITICELMIKRKLNIFWNCNARVDHASAELFVTMNRAGCKGILVGVESGDQEMLDVMKKGITLEEIERGVGLAKKHIRQVICSFILGMPGDTLKKAQRTIDFAKRLDPDYALFSIACPIPGSQIYEEAIESGLIDKEKVNWDNFSVFFPYLPTVGLSELSNDELVRLVKGAVRQYYFRVTYVLNRLKKIRSLNDINIYLKGISAGINYLVSKFR